jgi:hypothetical protein
MKLFILTAPDNMLEAKQFAESLASLAIDLSNQKMPVKTIEEIPSDASCELPWLTQVAWPKEGDGVIRLTMPRR